MYSCSSQSSISSFAAARKHFSVGEAERALPLVQRIVADIIDTYGHFTRLQAESTRDGVAKGDSGHEARRAEYIARLNALNEELNQIGCSLKDWASGLVDFPALLDGREIYLCWRYGEPSILYWHERSTGFAGRRSITPEFASQP